MTHMNTVLRGSVLDHLTSTSCECNAGEANRSTVNSTPSVL